MSAFLIEYHRKKGTVRCEEFGSLSEATRERLRLDHFNTDPDIEIVAVASASEESLRQSHSRYFSGV
ncbi:hypothetical protein D9543_11300 [Corynebacterium macginleyi]|uniref:Uncharacterized protein n=1 Tax=Corynebacterium macginleyi TaxID=38290 RepID=A0A3M0GGJ1_9CORY|nr:hypothetical protein D9543_11300 [Corynebacterium macginleyi]RMB63800.1 hypothetical protein D9V82_11760 [Corynebacterium macginleyi]RMB65096.1 hypothetical protein D9542_10810 [Corynebacterium macginleyi]